MQHLNWLNKNCIYLKIPKEIPWQNDIIYLTIKGGKINEKMCPLCRA
jgi:hypothetical protein